MSVTSTTKAPVSDALLNAVNPKAKTATDSVDADKDKFMTLLITQLKNQDPMNPLDNAQVTSQLAQLSTVTGVNKLNTTLESLKASYQSSENLQATGMINHGVLSAGKNIALSEGKAIYGVDLATAADSVDINIFSPAGKLVKTVSLGASEAGTAALAWDGKMADGTTAPDGNYSFTVAAKRGAETLKDATALTFGVVASVSTGTAGVKLNVPTVGQLTMADIKQIL
ncbi:flagellar hook assembly protein FlgD [Pseudoduganella namucuonensis]|uniref:Basal-body rod modification protein FlgD n=1 Tax=Pseudoduganella namucuonensis TaxID=1035707 RepID=A0A1I7L0G2_9BURK|nr:flagellar hook assembly protein FlgD [Pseudoduganella namucuonensis]SFV03054.1 flagellar basal-body rod modification protein FlgD [Pseudoduganella namucuonensis]